jgi:hypothetical protein
MLIAISIWMDGVGAGICGHTGVSPYLSETVAMIIGGRATCHVERGKQRHPT